MTNVNRTRLCQTDVVPNDICRYMTLYTTISGRYIKSASQMLSPIGLAPRPRKLVDAGLAEIHPTSFRNKAHSQRSSQSACIALLQSQLEAGDRMDYHCSFGGLRANIMHCGQYCAHVIVNGADFSASRRFVCCQ